MRAYAYGIRAVPDHITTTETGLVPLQVVEVNDRYVIDDLQGCTRWWIVVPISKPKLETSSQLGGGYGLR